MIRSGAELGNPDRMLDALRQRYAGGEPAAGILWNDVVASLLDHRSVRAYADRPLEPGALETIVAAAQSASSSSNLQLWSVVAVEDAGRKARLSELAANQRHVRDAPLFLVWLADMSRARTLADLKNADASGLEYLEYFLIAVIDAAIAAQNAVAALESLGLGAAYIGAIRDDAEAVARELKLPPLATPVFGLCVGYPHPDDNAAVKPRLPQSVVLHRETYRSPFDPAEVEAYDSALSGFQRASGMRDGGWIERVASRAGETAPNGREKLRAALRKFGFGLR